MLPANQSKKKRPFGIFHSGGAQLTHHKELPNNGADSPRRFVRFQCGYSHSIRWRRRFVSVVCNIG